jgi:peptidoglycan/LPS O-acetylase OafA/YrhL
MVTSEAQQNRKIGLDLLRAYAILSVVYGHGWYLVKDIATLPVYFSIKLDNVTMFFVLTGFLISLNLLKTLEVQEINKNIVKNFWLKRLARTYPLYFFMLTSIGVIEYFSNNALPTKYFSYFLYAQNINFPHPSFYSELWSLAVQEWFYFLLPLVMYVISQCNLKNKKNVLLCIVVGFIFCIAIYRILKVNSWSHFDIEYWDLNLRKQVVTRMDSLLYGFLMAYMLLYYSEFFKKNALVFFVFGICILGLNKFLFAENWFYLNYLHLSMAPIGAALLLPFFYGLNFDRKIINTIILQISSVSYAIYLVHMTPVMFGVVPRVIKFIIKIFPYFNEYIQMLSYIIYWLLTILFAAIAHYFIAKPASQFLLKKYLNK